MNELREKIDALANKYQDWQDHDEYHTDCDRDDGHITYNEEKFIPDIIDAFIAALPGEDRAIDIASDEDERYAFHTAKNAYMSAIEETKSLLQAAKENK